VGTIWYDAESSAHESAAAALPMTARKWVRKRPPAQVAAELRAHRAEVRAHATGQIRRETSSPKMRDKYGRYFPPDVAAREVAKETDWFQRQVGDRYAGVTRSRHWTLKKANVGRDKRTGRFTRRG
jgi:hypothetical protein